MRVIREEVASQAAGNGHSHHTIMRRCVRAWPRPDRRFRIQRSRMPRVLSMIAHRMAPLRQTRAVRQPGFRWSPGAQWPRKGGKDVFRGVPQVANLPRSAARRKGF